MYFRQPVVLNAASRAHLLSVLGAAALDDLIERMSIDVPSQNYPGRVYRIFWGGDYVWAIEGDVAVLWIRHRSLEVLPYHVALIGHRLTIEYDEAGYLAEAICLRLGDD
jgi:hypothetical protein